MNQHELRAKMRKAAKAKLYAQSVQYSARYW